MVNKELRPLSSFEQNVLAKLLSINFFGAEVIKQQLNSAQVRTVSEYDDNYGSIDIVTASQVAADVKMRVPVIGYTKDESGAPVEMLLHVVDGFISELEIIRSDGQPMQGVPEIDSMQVEVQVMENGSGSPEA